MNLTHNNNRHTQNTLEMYPLVDILLFPIVGQITAHCSYALFVVPLKYCALTTSSTFVGNFGGIAALQILSSCFSSTGVKQYYELFLPSLLIFLSIANVFFFQHFSCHSCPTFKCCLSFHFLQLSC